LFEGGFQVFDDFMGEDIQIGKVVGVARLSSLSQEMSRLPCRG
jgi:hypothetical protein